MSRTLTFYEFFAGGGMARMGLGDAWTCLLANDFDPLKTATYAANFGDGHLRQGDVFELTAADLPGQADLAWASSPCQDFSLAGKRAGLAGGRSSAFFGFWTLMQALGRQGRAPSVIVVENVVGMLTANGGADFTALCQALADEGYVFGALEIDAVRFVPQSRPRVFLIATKTAAAPELTQVEATLPFHSRRISEAYARLPQPLRASWRWWHLEFPPTHNEDVAQILEPDSDVVWFDEDRNKALLGRLNDAHTEKLNQAKIRNVRTVGTLFRRMRIERGEKVQRAEIRFDGFSGCLRTPGGGSSKQVVVVVEGDNVRSRLLTSRECARLMGVPDSYFLPESQNRALKVFGDGVAVPVVSFLADKLLTKLIVA